MRGTVAGHRHGRRGGGGAYPPPPPMHPCICPPSSSKSGADFPICPKLLENFPRYGGGWTHVPPPGAPGDCVADP